MPDVDPRVARSRSAVVEATLDLLNERGVAAITIEAISERSGVAKTTIYRHWDSKAEVVIDAIGTLIDPPPAPNTGSLRGDLRAVLGGLAQALTSSPLSGLLPSLIDAAERDPEFAELHRSEATTRHRVVRDVVVRGIERGELPSEVDPDEFLEFVTGPLFYRRWVSVGSVDPAFAFRVVDLVLAAYRDHEGTDR